VVPRPVEGDYVIIQKALENSEKFWKNSRKIRKFQIWLVWAAGGFFPAYIIKIQIFTG